MTSMNPYDGDFTTDALARCAQGIRDDIEKAQVLRSGSPLDRFLAEELVARLNQALSLCTEVIERRRAVEGEITSSVTERVSS